MQLVPLLNFKPRRPRIELSKERIKFNDTERDDELIATTCGNLMILTDIDECDAPNNMPCNLNHSVCVNTQFSYQCVCKAGYLQLTATSCFNPQPYTCKSDNIH